MIPKRYLFASMFIAAMLVLLAIVQAPRPTSKGGAMIINPSLPLCMDDFETIAEYRLQEGWAPRFVGNKDPDHDKAWPYCGGFGTAWEPASAYLADKGLALNGPGGNSEIVICKGIEWLHYRFNYPIASARLDPINSKRLLVTLMVGKNCFETRLIELPSGRVLWTTDSGPWSRFSWDGQAVVLGLFQSASKTSLMLSTIPVSSEIPELTMTLWDKKPVTSPSSVTCFQQDQYCDKGDRPLGVHLVIPWQQKAKFWFPRKDRLWVSVGNGWTMWGLSGDKWCRLAVGTGELYGQPPLNMGLLMVDQKSGVLNRKIGPLNQINWELVSSEVEQWPLYDPAWIWCSRESAATAWGLQWGKDRLSNEYQREALLRANRSEWITSSRLRVSVRGWLPEGPEVALREPFGVAWIWVGHKVIMKKLPSTSRSILFKKILKSN